MSTAPRGSILFRYTPGVGRVAAVDCGTGAGGVTSTCATAFSTTNQSLTVGTAAMVLHDTVGFSYGIATTTGVSGSFTVPTAGIYKVIPSIQCYGLGNGNIKIWIKVNHVNVDNTATITNFKQNDDTVITTEYLLPLNAGDSIEIWAMSTTADCRIDYVAAGGTNSNTYPAAPGVITNIYRIR